MHNCAQLLYYKSMKTGKIRLLYLLQKEENKGHLKGQNQLIFQDL